MNKAMLLTFFIFTGCSKYKIITNEELQQAFVINSSANFKGYFYNGTDKEFHYFTSKWSYITDKHFKISSENMEIDKQYIFSFEKTELEISLSTRDNSQLFGQTKFCKLYIEK